MSLSVVTASSEFKFNNSTTTISFTGRTHTAGNLLVVTVIRQNSGTPSVSNTAGDTWTQVPNGGIHASGGLNYADIFYAWNIKGGSSDVVSVNIIAGATYTTCALYEFQSSLGAFASDPYDTDQYNTGSAVTTFSTPTLSITGTSDVIVACGECDSANFSGGSGYHFDYDGVNGGGGYEAAEYHLVSASEAASMVNNNGLSSVFLIKAVAFKDTGAGTSGKAPAPFSRSRFYPRKRAA